MGIAVLHSTKNAAVKEAENKTAQTGKLYIAVQNDVGWWEVIPEQKGKVH